MYDAWRKSNRIKQVFKLFFWSFRILFRVDISSLLTPFWSISPNNNLNFLFLFWGAGCPGCLHFFFFLNVIPLDPPPMEYQEMQWRLPVRYAINKTTDRHPRKEKGKKKKISKKLQFFFNWIFFSPFPVRVFAWLPLAIVRATSNVAPDALIPILANNIYTVDCVYNV